jgi:A/G-specific adenine glycosylase
MMNKSAIVRALLDWFEKNARPLPWRDIRDPYGIWVSEVMLQQTQVKTVLNYWERWMRELPDLQSLAEAKPVRLHKLWEGLGYYTRVRNMQHAANTIIREHGGRFPSEYGQVLALPGIGRYTAGAICSIAFNQPTPILDGNVMRVLTRLFGIGGDPRERRTNSTLWRIAEELVRAASRARDARRACSNLNQGLMELGALICTPRLPKCDACPVSKWCVALRRDCVHELPATVRRAQSTQRHFVALVYEKRGRFLVRQRPAGVVNAHLWEFPNTELTAKTITNGISKRRGSKGVDQPCLKLPQAAADIFGVSTKSITPFNSIRHSITRYRIRLDVLRSAGATPKSPANTRWLTRPQLAALPFTAAHKKILAKLQETRNQRSPRRPVDRS